MSINAFDDSVGFLPVEETFFYTVLRGVEDKGVDPGKPAGIRSYYWLTSLFLRLVGVQVVQAKDVGGKVHYFSRNSLESYLKRHGDKISSQRSHPPGGYVTRDSDLSLVSHTALREWLQSVVENTKELPIPKDIIALVEAQHTLARDRIEQSRNFQNEAAKRLPAEIKALEDKIVEIEKRLGLRK